jgi:RNA polymerase sigma factor (sigma-70 family)
MIERDYLRTNPSIFLRLNRTDTQARQVAWREFHDRYAPIVCGFARKLGARPQDLDDVLQDVLVGFYSTSPTFVYDPARGRFRGYLKTCTCHVLRKRALARHRGAADGEAPRLASLEHLDPAALEVEQMWNDVWEQQLLRRAIEQLRAEIGHSKTFRAFELYVMLDRPAQEVSAQLELHVDNVYRSREQVTQMLRDRIDALRAGEE